MTLILPGVLGPAELDGVLGVIRDLPYQEGSATAGPLARPVKKNRELALDAPGLAAARELLVDGLRRTRQFEAWALPRVVTPFLFVRYEPGDGYGDHSDDGIMALPGGRFVRTDLSITVFLSPPESYDGGELVIDSNREPRTVKLPAGHAVVYPATTLHRVERVTRGTRLVAIAWVESLVRDHEERDLLHDLLSAIGGMPNGLADDARALVAKCRANLMRRWSG